MTDLAAMPSGKAPFAATLATKVDGSSVLEALGRGGGKTGSKWGGDLAEIGLPELWFGRKTVQTARFDAAELNIGMK